MPVVAATGMRQRSLGRMEMDTGTRVLTAHLPPYLGSPYLPWCEKQCANDTLLPYSTSILSQKSAAKTRAGTRSEWRIPDGRFIEPLGSPAVNPDIPIVKTNA